MTLSFINVAVADSGSRSYNWFAGASNQFFSCKKIASACPDKSMASNGDVVSLTGSGTLTIHPESVTGDGTFSDSTGIIGSGTWKATALESFVSFTSPSTVGGPEGGKAVILIQLRSTTGTLTDAVLTVICNLPTPPPGLNEDAAQLSVSNVINFNTAVSGFTVFVRTA